MRRLFISDLHLSAEQPGLTELFLLFLERRTSPTDELYILGDLFDSWIGDDDAPHWRPVIEALRARVDQGLTCKLLHGNRDFLLGRRFARSSGCALLRDPSLIRIGDQAVLLMHGDLLCTDDLPYQRFRRRVRNPVVKQLFLLQPLARRRRIAADYRQRSRQATAAKETAIMDVNPETVRRFLQRYRADRLIHGHTHRPADHLIRLGSRECTRHVLADWHSTQGEVLIEHQGRWTRERVLEKR